MKTFTIQVTDERWARRIGACLPVEINIETQEPVATPEEWAVMCSKQDLDNGLLKRERQKNKYKTSPIGNNDINITITENT